jgi:hypothetical protein
MKIIDFTQISTSHMSALAAGVLGLVSHQIFRRNEPTI